MKVPDKLSNRKIKELDGYSAKLRGEVITELPAILIGQFGKNDIHRDKISGAELMDFCLEKVFEGQEILGGRILLLECKDVEYLYTFYERFGFHKIEKEYTPTEYRQMIRLLTESELVEISGIHPSAT